MNPGINSASQTELGDALPAAAIRLLGSVLRCGETAGVIVETEFYRQDDPASHTFGGRTARNWPMYEDPGTLYVYRSYGIHWCANITVGPAGTGSAVLVRALRPIAGIETMWSRRPKAKAQRDLCSGPGKLCAALGIAGVHSGADLFDETAPVVLKLGEPVPDEAVLIGRRVGISKAVDRPWRFALAAEENVSLPKVQ